MIDYWEAIGRLAYYKDLNDEFEKILPAAGLIPRVTAQVRGDTETALDIPAGEYEAVQDFFDPILTEPFLSLMSAGELIWTYSFQESRDAIKRLEAIVSQAQPELFGPSTNYFITLGLVIADDAFRHSLRNREDKALKVIQRLSSPENNQIVSLTNNTDFDAYSLAFCALPWDHGCNVKYKFWPGHLHPLGVDASDWAGPSNTPASPAGSWVQVAAGGKE